MSKCKYYLEKEVVSYDGGITWNETGVTRKGNLYEESSEDCTDPSVQYRWINMDISTDYICDGTNKYYKQKKQVSYDGLIWQDVTPAEYQRGSIYEVNSPDCQPTYRWVNLDISTDYICDGTTKYYKQKKQVSYGGQEWQDVIPYEYQRGDVYETQSTDCGYVPPTPQYRWVNMDISTDYICDGTTKYYKQKKQVSYDEGQTWQDVTPAEYQRGLVYETQSTDCGYVPPSTSGNYLTTVALEDNTTIHYQTSTGSIYASFDNGETWVRENEVTINSGQKVLWKYVRYPSQAGVGRFSSTGNFNVEGNPMSLIFGDDFRGRTSLGSDYDYAFMLLFSGCNKLINAGNLALPATTLSLRCYDSMFQGCTSLQTAPALPATVLSESCYVDMFANCTSLTTAPVLPATTLAEDCYCRMFQGCTSLQTAPVLPATTLREFCYQNMFQGCTSLQTAPALSATTLTWCCYKGMFSGCTSLQTAPILSAKTLEGYCYDHMFADCTSLSNIKCLAKSGINHDSSTFGWVSNVSSTGTFAKAAGANWPRGDDGIPRGWTVIDA